MQSGFLTVGVIIAVSKNYRCAAQAGGLPECRRRHEVMSRSMLRFFSSLQP